MRIANLTHGRLFMLGAYVGVTALRQGANLGSPRSWRTLAAAALGGLMERLILRRLAGNALGQVLVTLGISFIIADACLIVWGGDPIPVPTPPSLQPTARRRRCGVSQPTGWWCSASPSVTALAAASC